MFVPGNVRGKISFFVIVSFFALFTGVGCGSSDNPTHDSVMGDDLDRLIEEHERGSSGGSSNGSNGSTSGTTGGNTGTTGGNTGTGSCDADGYKGPEFDIQVDSQCKAAYIYGCGGQKDGVKAACDIYQTFRDSDPSIPACPYCR